MSRRSVGAPLAPARALAVCGLLLLAGCSAPGSGDNAGAGPPPAPATAPGSNRGTASASASSPVSTPGSGPASAPGSASAPVAAAPARWQPRPGTPWQWQLSGTVDTSVQVPVYDIDGFENGADVVRRLHAAGRKVICYVNVGGWESFRPDAKDFPAALLGKGDGWPGERWLDIRRTAVLRPLLAARFDMCRAKGFDAVEPDLADGYANDTGFPLTAGQQLAFNRMVADLAHRRGLAVGLKNDVDQVGELVDDFDFSVDEQCAEFDECDALTPFVAADKAVFHVEYELRTDQFCLDSRRLRLSSMLKHLSLDAWRRPC
ncbi:endo alpha-1,4 polygalactosaminidase [Actinacidiphila sp. ITFR-21]|uniref:endo alpha-1,4 polygalactosaminidase n=1 Tax=Actinacidiphila sp. ITFR-21 TaxID=3075199 RepID=UPI00288A95A8|nr:endo alpha-1,4 polygalactosaminidase [Streptomyces sp. ITFR-21]WNI14554.1 endo alpha-1,4 polygalactosaminidase [Streptomyces sp. ITFR-21]